MLVAGVPKNRAVSGGEGAEGTGRNASNGSEDFGAGEIEALVVKSVPKISTCCVA